jgi:MuDR family transposase/SWIM zinc finger
MQLSTGDTFKSKKEAQNAIRMYAVDNNFTFETTDSTPKKYTIQCKERRAYGCDAIITAALRKKDNLFVIKKLRNAHNCPHSSGCGPASSSRYIADELRDMGTVEIDTRVGQLMNLISTRRGIKIGYLTAWKAKEEVLGREVGDKEAFSRAMEELAGEHLRLNPLDRALACNMKREIERRADEGRHTKNASGGRISSVINSIGPLDTADTSTDTLFISIHSSIDSYRYSRKIIELHSHARYNEVKESMGLGFIASSYDAFDAPYVLAMCYTPEYCDRAEGWIFFIRELLKVVKEGVLMIDYEKDVIEEMVKEMGLGTGEVLDIGSAAPKPCLFIKTRSICKQVYHSTESADAVALAWSLCNSPDKDSFIAHYEKIGRSIDSHILAFLESIPRELWAKHLSNYPLYGKNNSIVPMLDYLPSVFSLPIHDSVCVLVKMIHDNVLKKREAVSHAEIAPRRVPDKSRFGEELNKIVDRNISKGQSYEVDVGRTPGNMCDAPWIDPRKLNDDEGQTHGIVRYGGFRFYVDLKLRVCSCMRFQELLIPCSHACALISKVGSHPYSLIDDIYSIEWLGRMFSVDVNPIVNEPMRCAEERASGRRGPGRPRKCEREDDSDELFFSEKENSENR